MSKNSAFRTIPSRRDAMNTPDAAEEFVFLLAQHERLLAAYIHALIPHRQDADDVLQETKVVLWRSFGQFQRGTNFAAWSRRVAFHRVLAYRKLKKRDRLEFSEEFLQIVSAEHEALTDSLDRREVLLQECIRKLPADQREVLQLRYDEGLELDDMAARLSRTVAALYRQLSRIRHTLHDCVNRSLRQELQNESSI